MKLSSFTVATKRHVRSSGQQEIDSTLNRHRPTTSKQHRKGGSKCKSRVNVEIATLLRRQLSDVKSTWKHQRCFDGEILTIDHLLIFV